MLRCVSSVKFDVVFKVDKTNKTSKKSLTKLLTGNNLWHKDIKPHFFNQHAKGQQPDILFIACSDSRVTPSVITNSELGQLFVMRNIANLIVPSDESMQAVVRYAVTHLKVKHIVICGHYGCGGVKAAMNIAESSSQIEQELSAWLEPVVNLYKQNEDKLSTITDETKRYKTFVRINVEAQVENMLKLDAVRESHASSHQTQPFIHGAIYNIENGKIELLGDNQDSLKNELDEIAIQEQLLMLTQKATSYNPFNFIGANLKISLIQTALDDITKQDKNISCELKSTSSMLYQALNYKRLVPFSFKRVNQSSWFSNKATSILNIEAKENHILSKQMTYK